jgi:ABC-type sugar transport system substrate-binding protein/DNA-binding CsgD family transcriptional regulator
MGDGDVQGLRHSFNEREVAILRLMAAGLSNQEIAERLFLAVATVKWYIRQINDKLDTHSRTQTIARAQQMKLIGADRDETSPPSELPRTNPYKGLHAFQEADAADFFGRETFIQQLLNRLAEPSPGQRLLALVGPSGSGKSSVVKAGLIPALRQGKLPGSAHWLLAEMLPGDHPFEELEIALLRVAATQPPSLLPQLREDERGLLRAARRILPDDQHELVLVIDQFEEVFTLAGDPAETAFFLNSLLAAVTDTRSPLWVIITLRADFYDRPLRHAAFGDLLHHRAEVVLPPTSPELEQIIVRPAARVGLAVESALVTTLVAAASQQPGALPLLEYTLTELFENRRGGQLTLADYQAMGGTLGALTRRADALYATFDAEGQAAIRQVFLRLVTLGEGVEDTRRRALRAELLSLGQAENLEAVMDIFGQYRLLTLDRDSRTHEATVEVAHEALIQEWGRLRAWLNDCRTDIRLQRLLAAAAVEWVNGKRDPSFLLSGSRLAQFEEWAAKTPVALTPDERAYLEASLAERTRQATAEQARQAREQRLERRSRSFLRALAVVLLLATLGAFGLTGVAVNQSQVAQRNAVEAQSLALASAAQLALNEGDAARAVALAKAAQQITGNPPPLAQHVLDEAAFAPGTQRLFQETLGSGVLAAPKKDLRFAMIAHFGRQFGGFGPVMVRGMDDACAALKVACRWLSEPVVGVTEMVGYWDQALAANPDGIGTTLIIPETRARVEQAAKQGIPVVVFNIARGGSEPDPSLPALLYIGSNEFVSGQTNARRVFVEAQAEGVTIQRGVCTNQAIGSPALAARCGGVKSIFQEQGIPLDQLQINFGADNDEDPPEVQAKYIADYFKTHPETKAIFMLGPAPADALNLYLRQAHLKPGQLYATTHDTSPEILRMIHDGYLLQTIDQQPYMQGFQTIISLYLYRQYGLRPSGFINTSSVIDKSNVDLVAKLIEAGYR